VRRGGEERKEGERDEREREEERNIIGKRKREGVKNLKWVRGKIGRDILFSCAVHLKSPHAKIDFSVRST
jgi:hypothetical protein